MNYKVIEKAKARMKRDLKAMQEDSEEEKEIDVQGDSEMTAEDDVTESPEIEEPESTTNDESVVERKKRSYRKRGTVAAAQQGEKKDSKPRRSQRKSSVFTYINESDIEQEEEMEHRAKKPRKRKPKEVVEGPKRKRGRPRRVDRIAKEEPQSPNTNTTNNSSQETSPAPVTPVTSFSPEQAQPPTLAPESPTNEIPGTNYSIETMARLDDARQSQSSPVLSVSSSVSSAASLIPPRPPSDTAVPSVPVLPCPSTSPPPPLLFPSGSTDKEEEINVEEPKTNETAVSSCPPEHVLPSTVIPSSDSPLTAPPILECAEIIVDEPKMAATPAAPADPAPSGNGILPQNYIQMLLMSLPSEVLLNYLTTQRCLQPQVTLSQSSSTEPRTQMAQPGLISGSGGLMPPTQPSLSFSQSNLLRSFVPPTTTSSMQQHNFHSPIMSLQPIHQQPTLPQAKFQPPTPQQLLFPPSLLQQHQLQQLHLQQTLQQQQLQLSQIQLQQHQAGAHAASFAPPLTMSFPQQQSLFSQVQHSMPAMPQSANFNNFLFPTYR